MSGRPVRKTAEKGRRQMDRGRAAQQRSRSRSRSASFYTSVRHLQDGCFENLVVKLRSAVGMPPNLDSRKVYSNSSSPRGLALIIANDKFTNRRLPARPGSDVDVKNIKKLLAGLGYDIFANRNETAEVNTKN
uniref:Caspase family p20 domain-containing protein n=1 Tax=Globodera rostochiensis TaxID=31243 RepID=A0A914HNS5_GLORO